MPEYLSSGIHVEENSSAEQFIASAPTAVTAFIGRTLRGPVNQPIRIDSFKSFRRTFGGLWPASTLTYAVEQFFENGGREAIVVRVTNGGRKATISLPAGDSALTLQALNPGSREALRASVDYDKISTADTDRFNLVIQRMRTQRSEHVEDQEIYANVSVHSSDTRCVADALLDSRLVRVVGALPQERPERTVTTSPGNPVTYTYANPSGDDGQRLTDYDIIGSAVEGTGIFALDRAGPFNLLCIPPLARDCDIGPATLLVASRFCKQRGAILLIDSPVEWRTAEDALARAREFNLASENAVLLFPRLKIRDRQHGMYGEYAASGAVAGVLARLDERGHLWQEPGQAGVRLRTGRFSCEVTPAQSAKLAKLGINALPALSIGFPSYRLRTLAGPGCAPADWRFLAARRLALHICDSIARGTRWVVFEHHDERLWERLRLRIEEFLEVLFVQGALAGQSSEEAYRVVCDSTVNTEVDVAQGIANIVVGFAISNPKDFHVYHICQSGAGTSLRRALARERERLLEDRSGRASETEPLHAFR